MSTALRTHRTAVLLGGALGLAAQLGCSGLPATDQGSETTEPLFTPGYGMLWNNNARGVVPTIGVCFSVRPRIRVDGVTDCSNEIDRSRDCAGNPMVGSNGQSITDSLRATIQQQVTATWASLGNVSLNWMGDCPIDAATNTHKETSLPHLIMIQFQDADVTNIVGKSNGFPTIIQYNWVAINSGNDGFNLLHEFGHALGFEHEWLRDDFFDAQAQSWRTSHGTCVNNNDCNPAFFPGAPGGVCGSTGVNSGLCVCEAGERGQTPGLRLTATADPSSIMNYCHVSSLSAALTSADFSGLAEAYGNPAFGRTAPAPALGNLAGYQRSSSLSAIVYTASNSHVKELSINTNWNPVADLSAIASGPVPSGLLTAYVRNDGNKAVVYRISNNTLRELVLTSSGWSNTDLTGGAPGAPLTSGDPSGYTRSDYRSAVVYRASTNHIFELSLASGASSWATRDLTNDSGGALAAGDPVAYVRADGANAVVYRSSDNHIREMRRPFNGSWTPTDLSGAGATAVGKPHPYVRSDGVSVVLYRSSDNHVRELSLGVGATSWALSDLTSISGAPAAVSDPIGYVRGDGTNAVVFRSSDNHVREISLTPSGWSAGDLSQITSAPAATGEPTAFARHDRTSSVLYKTSDGHVHEIALPLGGNWGQADLTNIAGGP